MRNLDLDALQIFKAVADHGGVARAAAHLNRVQSNVSTRLKQLEATLEAPLFRRQNRRLVLSEQGRVLLSYADRLLRLSAEAQAAVRDGAPQGLLRIGTMESTAAARLPPILAAYHAAWPQVRIELVTGTSGALAAKVRNYEIEAAFVAQPFEAQAAVRDGAPQGLLRIGTMESTAAARLPPILAAYHAAWPQVRIELVTGTSGALAAKVRNYEIEAAFVAQPFEAQGLAQQPAFDEELALISPLAWPEIHGPKDVGDRSVIAFAAGCSYRRILEAWFGQEGVAPDKVMEFASYHAIVACVAAGSGVAIVPRSVLALLGAEPSLRVTPLSGKHGRAQTRLVWRADDETPALQALQRILAQRRQ
jgi:DNA-binding transcriptional LysR family regulator